MGCKVCNSRLTSHYLRVFQRVLAANGAAKISAYVTHGIFPNRSWQRFEHDNGGTARTYTCSILEVSFPTIYIL